MAGGDRGNVSLLRQIEKGPDLNLGVAGCAGIGGPGGLVSFLKGGDHLFLERLRGFMDFMGDSENIRAKIVHHGDMATGPLGPGAFLFPFRFP